MTAKFNAPDKKVLEKLKNLRATVGSYEDTLKYYEQKFQEDGVIDQ